MPDLATTGRRFLAVIQDPRGYPPSFGELDPAPPEGPAPPMVLQVVKADDYEARLVECDRYRRTLEYLAAPKSWAGDPLHYRTKLYGHDTPYELAKAALRDA